MHGGVVVIQRWHHQGLQLVQLVQVGLIAQDRQGTSLICRTNYPVMHGLIEDQLAECCAGTPETRDQRPG